MIPVAIPFVSCLDANGNPCGDLPEFASNRDIVTTLYRWMVLTRTFDTRAISLQRTGRLGTYASSLGQEAASVGIGHAMDESDVLLPSFREHGAQLVRGVTARELLLYWGGDERGSDFSGPREDFPVCIPVGSHAPHATGVALAFKLRREPRAAVCVMGDGATSRGDVYESMNVAGAWTLPVVFVIVNNQWAISVPRRAQTAAETLAQKAVACGFDGVQVDGNDVIAVRQVMVDALDRARGGGGPTLVEAVTYRLSDHTTADDASRYRDDEEVGRHWKEDPISRMRDWLDKAHGWTREEEESLIAQCEQEIEKSAESYLAETPGARVSMFDYLYDELPTPLAWQRAVAAGQK